MDERSIIHAVAAASTSSRGRDADGNVSCGACIADARQLPVAGRCGHVDDGRLCVPRNSRILRRDARLVDGHGAVPGFISMH